jgi:hypothetical protein
LCADRLEQAFARLEGGLGVGLLRGLEALIEASPAPENTGSSSKPAPKTKTPRSKP